MMKTSMGTITVAAVSLFLVFSFGVLADEIPTQPDNRPAFFPGLASDGAGAPMLAKLGGLTEGPFPGTACQELVQGLCACLMEPDSTCDNFECSRPGSTACGSGRPPV